MELWDEIEKALGGNPKGVQLDKLPRWKQIENGAERSKEEKKDLRDMFRNFDAKKTPDFPGHFVKA